MEEHLLVVLFEYDSFYKPSFATVPQVPWNEVQLY